MNKKERFISSLPTIVSVTLLVSSLFLTLRAIFNYSFLMIGLFLDKIPAFILFGNPLKPTIWGMLAILLLSVTAWLISTKVNRFKSIKWKTYIFFQMFAGIVAFYVWWISAPVYNHVVPYLLTLVNGIDMNATWSQLLLGNPDSLMVFIMFFPTIVITLILLWLAGRYSQHSDSLKVAFREFEFNSYWLQRFIGLGETESWPDVVLGKDSKTKELVVQLGKDRPLNNSIIGSIGTGKTAALVLQLLNQDLHWMAKFINKFEEIHEDEDYISEDKSGMYLNGISVIEPSNDLCQKVFQLVKAHNIPDEAVFYIDPTNPETPCINAMQGPVDQVAEAWTMVIEGLAEEGNSNFFFQQSQRNHLKQYIYLLKLHDPDKDVIFDDLIDIYNSPQLVRRMHEKLKKTFPEDIASIKDRDERNHWKIVQQTDEWFDMHHLPLLSRNGTPEKVKIQGDYYGEPAYYDSQAEMVKGLRNILSDLGANKLIRRVLFGKSNFNFDKHLEFGGVLLVNTAKGELGGLSNVFGKLILLSLQNAVFRRKPNVSNFHHILVDEFPDYIYRPFKEFPAQSRKYKTIITVVAQTVAQLADKYGEMYLQTLLTTLRHKMVYGDVSEFDAKLFSGIFGEAEHFEETQNEQSISPLQENPVTRAGSSYVRTEEAILSPNDIIFQNAFQVAAKLVKNNRPMPVRQVNANFVPKKEFKVAKHLVTDEKGEYWIQTRERFLQSEYLVQTPAEEEIEHGEREVEQQEAVEIRKEHDDPIIIVPDNEQPVRVTYHSDRQTKHVAPPVIEHTEASDVDASYDPLSELFSSTAAVGDEEEKASLSVLGKEENDLLKVLQNESSKVSSTKPESIFDELEEDYK
ncbi:type IV secretory system conjugative DNA transfer family protein [Terribacillus sp. DMT04]|uniref:type IV secretory system conjugative DNA transfer family protein n=1 Tax=Terribacillus sp. DMT04 TaxID=2850441 RepID=UPI0020B89B33|nr:type IV secretory system conjugative DNA transfer family protein [Terribacillus sp. DMT04]